MTNGDNIVTHDGIAGYKNGDRIDQSDAVAVVQWAL